MLEIPILEWQTRAHYPRKIKEELEKLVSQKYNFVKK